MVIANSLWELNIAVVKVIIKIFGLHGPFSIVSKYVTNYGRVRCGCLTFALSWWNL